jgi:hypothetical protein
LGGNDAANAESAREHVAHEIFNANMMADWIQCITIAGGMLCEQT